LLLLCRHCADLRPARPGTAHSNPGTARHGTVEVQNFPARHGPARHGTCRHVPCRHNLISVNDSVNKERNFLGIL
jgi:hypothetical protein